MKFNILQEQTDKNDLLEKYVSTNIFSKYKILKTENDKLIIDIETGALSFYEESVFEELHNNNIVINMQSFGEYEQYYSGCTFSSMKYFPKIINSGYRLSFANNYELTDISNLPLIYGYVENIIFSNCHRLENFTGLKETSYSGKPLKYGLYLQETNIKNLKSLPRNSVDAIHMSKTKNFDSYSGVSQFDKLLSISYEHGQYNTIKNEISNSIEILLNRSLIKIDTPYKHKMFDIIKKYFSDNREDYIMDCAVELIDAGFEEAAEL